MQSDAYIEPVFDFEHSESGVFLASGAIEITVDGAIYKTVGEARLDILPKPRIRFCGRFAGGILFGALSTVLNSNTHMSFSFNGRHIEVLLDSIRIQSSRHGQFTEVSCIPSFEPILLVGDQSTLMTRVVFHVFNFVDVIGTRRSIRENEAIEYVTLTNDDWIVYLQSLPITKRNIKELKAAGGYRLTHVGMIEKCDGSDFSGQEGEMMLEALCFFLSFAKGGWCPAICPVGFDRSGRLVWQRWSSPREFWRPILSWFDPHHSEQLQLLFALFMRRWVTDDWEKALRECIYWYVNANNPSAGIEAGIIFTQAAIERLSYEYTVRERRLLGVDGFKQLKASDKFRLLFSSLDIPLDIPDECIELRTLASRVNWQDSPHALTEIRNSIVHPERKNREQLADVLYEAWNLGLWYLEMSILAICGYNGHYGNRLKKRFIGQVENVPWKK